VALRQLRFLGDPVLRASAAPVESVDAEVRTLIADMFDTMYAEEGVGLAAPQIGVSSRVIVVDPHDDQTAPFALINPAIVEHGVEEERGEEGCLSIPGLREMVDRPSTIVIEGLDRDGAPVRIEADGLLARILQHEVDHINGILFIDHLSPLKRKLLLAKWQKMWGDG
jgi:peptide deformylase